jgi:hypothetical protein
MCMTFNTGRPLLPCSTELSTICRLFKFVLGLQWPPFLPPLTTYSTTSLTLMHGDGSLLGRVGHQDECWCTMSFVVNWFGMGENWAKSIFRIWGRWDGLIGELKFVSRWWKDEIHVMDESYAMFRLWEDCDEEWLYVH